MIYDDSICYSDKISLEDYIDKIYFFSSNYDSADYRLKIFKYHYEIIRGTNVTIAINKNYIRQSVDKKDYKSSSMDNYLDVMRNIVSNFSRIDTKMKEKNKTDTCIFMTEIFVYIESLIISKNDSLSGYYDLLNRNPEINKSIEQKINPISQEINAMKKKEDEIAKKIDSISEIVGDKEKGLTKEVNDLNESLKNEKEELKNQKSDIITQMVAIVSIFVAISFVMFGGMSLLNGLFDFSNMQYVPVIELVCLGSLLGIIMIAIIYAFIIFTLRIVDKDNKIKASSLINKTLSNVIKILVIIFVVSFLFWICIPSDKIYEVSNNYKNQTESQENIKNNQNDDSSNKQNINSK